MRKSFLIALGILIATAVFCYVSLYIMVKDRAPTQEAFPAPASTQIATFYQLPISSLAITSPSPTLPAHQKPVSP